MRGAWFIMGAAALALAGCLARGGLARAGEPLAFPRVPPLEPRAAEGSFELVHGFRARLVAHEPALTSPVAVEYDEHGNAWVLEMRDYPFTDKSTDVPFEDKSSDKPLGRVRVLSDADGDGFYETSRVFAEDLSWPTGLAFWNGGIFVAATPDLWYLKDQNGDGLADLREKWYTGFRKFNIQAVINNLRWGLDHRVYAAGGTNGGTITSPRVTGAAQGAARAAPVALAANDFRFDPVGGRFELLSGGARFGHSFDDWGNRFLCNIRNPVIHVALQAKYLARNGYVAYGPPLVDAADTGDTLPVYRISPSEPWRTLRAQRWSADTQARVYPRSELVPDGYFTSASGVTIYRGHAYPRAFYGNAFLADVAGNLVHRQVLSPRGVTFRAQRAEAETEFMRSTDPWFRPVNFTNAPDGTLHVVDMYRETIEHPWSIPDDIKAVLDLESGRDKGRIWRIEPPGFVYRRPTFPARMRTEELVALLEHPSCWWRETAHRLLYQRQDRAAVEPLLNLLARSAAPVARVHALWSLEGLNALGSRTLLAAMADPFWAVRAQALLIAEPRLAEVPALFAAALRLAEDPDVRVRFQAAFSLGEVEDAQAARALAAIARRDAGDSLVADAILSSAARRSGALLALLLEDEGFAQPQEALDLVRRLAQTVGARQDPKELNDLGRLLVEAPDTQANRLLKPEALCGLAEALNRRGSSLAQIYQKQLPQVPAMLEEHLRQTQTTAFAPGATLEQQLQCIRLLGLAEYTAASDGLVHFLGAAWPQPVQLAAVRTLAAYADPRVPEVLLAGWKGYSPPVRTEVVEGLLARAERVPLLLDLVEQGTVGIAQIPPSRRGLLMRHADPALRERALRLFAADAPAARREVIEPYARRLNGPADAARGRAVFERECATCHRLDGKGFDVGPDLLAVSHHAPQQVLMNILDPNREVSPQYLEYVAATHDGRTLTGMIAAETAASITLQRASDVRETVLREQIAELATSGVSLMPEGLEKKITVDEMADLLAYLLAPRRAAPGRADPRPAAPEQPRKAD